MFSKISRFEVSPFPDGNPHPTWEFDCYGRLSASDAEVNDSTDNWFCSFKSSYVGTLMAGDGVDLPKFKGQAYDGSSFRIIGTNVRGVYDLSQLKITAAVPVLRSKNVNRVVGHVLPADVVIENGVVNVSGVVSGIGPDAIEFAKTLDQKFPWKFVIGCALPSSVKSIPAGQSVEVNGRTLSGPIDILVGSELRAISIEPLSTEGTSWGLGV